MSQIPQTPQVENPTTRAVPRRVPFWAMPLAAAVFISGCALFEPVDEDVDDDADVAEDVQDIEDRDLPDAADEGLDPEAAELEEDPQRAEALARGLDPDDPLDAAILEDPDSPLEIRRVHFAFDSSEIREEDEPVVRAHGEFLGENREVTMTVEGHTDERGSREYNLALGERRAESVKRLLMSHGARSAQIEVVSYGEEAPRVNESNEEAWAENRRAELIYD